MDALDRMIYKYVKFGEKTTAEIISDMINKGATLEDVAKYCGETIANYKD